MINLVQFDSLHGGWVYINPDTVSYVFSKKDASKEGEWSEIVLTWDNTLIVRGTIDEVKAKLGQ